MKAPSIEEVLVQKVEQEDILSIKGIIERHNLDLTSVEYIVRNNSDFDTIKLKNIIRVVGDLFVKEVLAQIKMKGLRDEDKA